MRSIGRDLLIGLAMAPAAGWPMLGCAGVTPARIHVVQQPWSWEGFSGRRLTTAHFNLISTLGDLELEEALPELMEELYERYEATITPSTDGADRLTVYVLGTRNEWERFSRRKFPDRFTIYSKITSGGFTEGDTSVSFYSGRAATLAALAHEGWHQYVGSRCRARIPAWLNEGLACYHEAIEFPDTGPEFTPRRNTIRIENLRTALQQDNLLALRDLVNTDAGAIISNNNSNLTHTYYAQLWALVTFLRHDARHARAFARLLEDLSDGTFQVRVSAATLSGRGKAAMSEGEAALFAYFGASPESLQSAYFNHVVRTVGF